MVALLLTKAAVKWVVFGAATILGAMIVVGVLVIIQACVILAWMFGIVSTQILYWVL